MNNFQVNITDGPLDLSRIAKSGQMFRWRLTERGWNVYDGPGLHKIVQLATNKLAVESTESQFSFESLFRLERNHRRLLEEIVQRGPELESSLQQMTGLRMMRPRCRTETLFSFLCSANNHVSRITQMVWNLTQSKLAGSEAPTPFQTIETIAHTTDEELRLKGFGYRAKTIPVVAQRLLADGGEKLIDELGDRPFSEARAYLLNLPGVGPKLADCICLFAFDHQTAVPIDTHIWQQLTRIYYPEWQETPLTHKKYDYAANAFRDRFGEHAGVAHQFLFVENLMNKSEKK